MEDVYGGVVKRLTADAKAFIIECPAILDWYGNEARLKVADKPDDVDIGDTVNFTIRETAKMLPVATWLEAVKPKAAASKQAPKEGGGAKRSRPEEPSEPQEGEELYEGKISKQSAKDPKLYFVDCPVVSSWYGCEARVSAETLFLAGAGIGDQILFALGPEDASGSKKPTAIWAEMAGSASAKKRLRGNTESKAKANGKPSEDKRQAPVNGGGGDELTRLKEELAAEKTAKLQAQLDATQKELKLERMQKGSSGDLSSAQLPSRQAPPESDSDDEPGPPKGSGKGKGKGDGKGKTSKAGGAAPAANVFGAVRFADADMALAALALYGTELDGAEVRPEADSKAADGTWVHVKGISGDTTENSLRGHFAEVGKILACVIRPLERQKGGKDGQKGGKDGQKGGKDGQKGAKDSQKGGKDGQKGGKDGQKGVKGKAGKGGPAAAGGNVSGGGRKGGGATSIGELRFTQADGALSSLALYGSELAGHPGQSLRVEVDAKIEDGSAVKVFGVPGSATQKDLRQHFAECGPIASCRVVTPAGKGAAS